MKAVAPERLGLRGNLPSPADLPIPAREGTVVARIRRDPSELQCAVWGHVACRNQFVHVVLKPGVEAALDVVTEKEDQKYPGSQQRCSNPEDRTRN